MQWGGDGRTYSLRIRVVRVYPPAYIYGYGKTVLDEVDGKQQVVLEMAYLSELNLVGLALMRGLNVRQILIGEESYGYESLDQELCASAFLHPSVEQLAPKKVQVALPGEEEIIQVSYITDDIDEYVFLQGPLHLSKTMLDMFDRVSQPDRSIQIESPFWRHFLYSPLKYFSFDAAGRQTLNWGDGTGNTIHHILPGETGR